MDQVFPQSAAKIKSCSTWYFSCKNHIEQTNFERFQRADVSIITVTFLIFLSSLLVGSFVFRMYFNNSTVFNLISSIIACANVVLGFVLIRYLCCARKSQSESQSKYYVHVLSYLENLFLINLVTSSLFMMASVNIRGLCIPNELGHDCLNSANRENRVHEAMMGIVLMFPVMHSMAVKSVKSEVVLLCWLASVIFIMVVIVVFDYHKSWYAFVGFAAATALKLFEYQRQKISMYFLAQELSITKTENDRLAEENRASELKHLIGNVAHDLKTPLSSLNMAIDLLSGELSEFVEKTVNVPELLGERIRTHVACVEENLRNMKNVNAFMLMTINRCMDYTKATTGLKLVPKLGTVALLETIALPLHVMNAMHDGKMKIELMPVSANICNHIITDMQWLQENVMCLLSNAVKYSNKGLIRMSVSLVTHSSFQRGNKVLQSNASENSPLVDKYGKHLKMQYKQLSLRPIDSKERRLCDMISNRPVSLSLLQPELVLSADTNDELSPLRGELVERQSQFLRIEVEDNGIGLSDEVMQSLFSPFKQAQRLAGGTGLGLFSLSRRLDAIGGFYGVERRSDGLQGSVFWFEIPYKPDTEYAENLVAFDESRVGFVLYNRISRDVALTAPLIDSSQPDIQSGIDTSSTTCKQEIRPVEVKLNILLADDTLSIQKMTCMLLRRQGHIVTVAENGAEALEMVTAKYTECEEYRRNGGSTPPCLFDVVLMDFQMPIMDELEATSRIRKVEADLLARSCGDVISVFHQKIVGLSANSDEETVQLALDAGVDDFMEKPFKAGVFDEIWSRIGNKM